MSVSEQLLDSDSEDGFYDQDSDTTSITSSVFDFCMENGRRYHAFEEEKYFMPNDGEEMRRLDLGHEVFCRLLNLELHLSPIKNPQKILDLGTGTGIWAIDMADKYPSASVIGTDLSPIQPDFVPPNLQFVIEDYEQCLDMHRPNSYDFIYGRTLAGSISDPDRFIMEIHQCLKPNGYCELLDIDLSLQSIHQTLPKDSYYAQYLGLLREASKLRGRPLDTIHRLKVAIEECGFKSYHEVIKMLPLGPWLEDKKLRGLGIWGCLFALESIEPAAMRLFTQALGWTLQEVQVLLAKVRNELKDKSLGLYVNIHIISAQK